VGIRLDEDHHVHSTFSDDAVSTLEENMRAVRERGLRTVCLAEHVRRDSVHVPGFVSAVEAIRPVPGLRVLAGLEAKILDRQGRLDLPGDITGIDRVLIADHQFPGETGPVPAGQVRTALARGETTAADVVEALVRAIAAALGRVSRPQLAHLFSIMPKLGLAESEVPEGLLRLLARQARAAGAVVEISEKWACPSPRTLCAFTSAGVRVVASTGSHDCTDVGVYHRVPVIIGRMAAVARR
jgi:putative hydrolase